MSIVSSYCTAGLICFYDALSDSLLQMKPLENMLIPKQNLFCVIRPEERILVFITIDIQSEKKRKRTDEKQFKDLTALVK